MADDTLDGGGGDPDGGSPGGEQGKPPGNGEWIPKARFDEAIGSLKDQLRELQAQVKQPAQQSQETVKRYTRSQLKEAVAAGQISQDQADDIWDNQLLEQAATVGRNSATQAEREGRIDGDIAQYKRLKPDVMKDGTQDRLRVHEEFKYLVSTGHDPKSRATELAALRAAYGPLDRLEKAQAGRPGAEHHQEAGGGSGGGRPANPGSGKLIDTLTDRERRYHQSLIDKGVTKDWNEVEATLKFANANIRRKHGATV